MEKLLANNAMPRQRLLIALFSSLFLGVILSAIIYIEIFFEWWTWFTFFMTLSSIFFLYLVVPLLSSMYISQQTGDAEKGRQTGYTIGQVSMVLALLATEILFTIYFQLHPPNQPMDFSGIFFVGSIFVHLFGLLIAVLGAILGAILGVWLRKKG